jgi:large subunit ribosomal protein L15
MKLNNLKPTPASRKARKRLGCGIGSGHGKTCGRGHKGQRSRTGGSIARGFEGGQMPLIRRLPKRGFTPLNKTEFQIVNVAQLECFGDGTSVDAQALCEAGLVKNPDLPVKLLGQGDLGKKLRITVAAASAAARTKVEAAGGSIVLAGVK